MEQSKKPMQNVNFRTVGELLGFLPEEQLEMVEQLRTLVTECLPEIEEGLSFNVPFYRRHKLICYIWPGAVSWGGKTWDGVEFGFNYGYLLADEIGYLDRGNRKQVYNKRFYPGDRIDEEILRAYLFEAWELDEMMYVEKMKGRRNKGKSL